MMSLDVICIMNDVMQCEGVTSSGVSMFFENIFMGDFFGTFIMITYGVDLTSFL
jgi:hypothetical protein